VKVWGWPLLLSVLAWAGASSDALTQPQASSVQATPIVIGQSYALPSVIMKEAREINVWLPPGYDDSARSYPVLVLLDGGRTQDFHHISGLAQLGAIAGTSDDFILVGVATQDRRNELTFRAQQDTSLIVDYPTHGQSARFRRFLTEEVLPFVRSNWRVDGDAALIGESLAGLFVVETYLETPDLFDRYVAVSPSLWWDEQALSQRAPDFLDAAPHHSQLWLTIADEGGTMQAGMDRLVAALRARPGLTWRYTPWPGATHATIFHEAALAAIRDLYPPPPSQ